jgi:hypothetical protein
VPGQLAAAVHRDHGSAVKGPFVVLGAFAGRVDRGVFEQQDRAGRLAGDDVVMEFALDVPTAGVVDEVRGETQLFENSRVMGSSLDLGRLHTRFSAEAHPGL